MPLLRAEGTVLVFDKAEHHLYRNGGGGGGADNFCQRGAISASGFHLWRTESTSVFCPEYCMFRKLRQPLVCIVSGYKPVFTPIVAYMERNLCKGLIEVAF